MANTYFLDESGKTGDLIHAGSSLAFGRQPYFSLAAVAIDDPDGIAPKIEKLRRAHRIKATELKSSALSRKPGFGPDLIALLDEKCPIFVAKQTSLIHLGSPMSHCDISTDVRLLLKKSARNPDDSVTPARFFP